MNWKNTLEISRCLGINKNGLILGGGLTQKGLQDSKSEIVTNEPIANNQLPMISTDEAPRVKDKMALTNIDRS